MRPLGCIVLAAGEGLRMKSDIPKPLHTIGGKTLLDHVLTTLLELQPRQLTVVVGAGRERVITAIPSDEVQIAIQEPQLGTGHAADCTRELYEGFDGDILITCADIPLVRVETLQRLISEHRRLGATATMLTTIMPDADGYGRVIRDDDGLVREVIEHKDADEATRQIREINTGIFCFRAQELFDALAHLENDNLQGEYYLPDTLTCFRRQGMTVAAVIVAGPDEVMGINDRVQLAAAEKICRDRTRQRLMLAGVTMIDPANTYVDDGVSIGPDTVILPGAQILGASSIGSGCEIGGNVLIRNSTIGDGCLLRHCASVVDSRLEDEVQIGPFANIRGNSLIKSRAVIGQGEVNRSEIGEDSKAVHFSYLGDTVCGAGVNIGAGTITCNYDGKQHNHTIIEDGAFIGSDTILVAPVRVGRGAYIGAGSVITSDVPAGSLGIGRTRQRIIEGWVERTGRQPD